MLPALALLALLHIGRASAGVSLAVDPSGRKYSVSVNDQIWLQSSPDGRPGIESPVAFHANGRWWGSGDGSLALKDTFTSLGVDAWGPYDVETFDWETDGGPPPSYSFRTTFRTYSDVPAIVFDQIWQPSSAQAVTGTSVGNANQVVSTFPSWSMDSPQSLGFLCYAGNMAWYPQIALWSSNTSYACGGIAGGGPLVLFDSQARNVLVFSSLNNFMSASFAQSGSSFRAGPFGNASEIPAGFSLQTFIFYGANGINQAMLDWGHLLLTRYGKPFDSPRHDFVLNYLGYYTDNGAFYYYATEKNKNYEQTMLDVKAYSRSAGIPYRYLQLDSWWYFKGFDNGVKNWTAMPFVFPHGIEYLSNITEWPIVAHNRYWAPDTTYAVQNGGDWDFIVESTRALPLQQEFWDYLMVTSRRWGLRTYEQDWLDDMTDNLVALHSNVTLGRMWLRQLSAGAQSAGITVQLCMSYPRHIMQSVELEAVTHARTSDDYQPSNLQWQLGITSIFAHAVGIAPFKDTFWTTAVQPGNPYNKSENYPELESAIASLSTGSVAPGDMIGGANVELIMRSCMADGTLLQPSRPAASIDATFARRAFGSSVGPDGELYSTYTQVGPSDQFRWYYVLGAMLDLSFSVTPQMLSPERPALWFQQVAFDGRAAKKLSRSSSPEQLSLQLFDQDHPIVFNVCDRDDFQLWHSAPVLGGWALLGELSKWVSVSTERFVSIDSGGTSLRALMNGVEGEHVIVTLAWVATGVPNLVQLDCYMDSSGSATLVADGQGQASCTNDIGF